MKRLFLFLCTFLLTGSQLVHPHPYYNYTPRDTDKRTIKSVFKEARFEAGRLSRMMKVGFPTSRQNREVVDRYTTYFLPQLITLGAFYLFSESLVKRKATVDSRSQILITQVRNQLRDWFEELADVIPPEKLEELRSRILADLEQTKAQKAEYELGIETLDKMVGNESFGRDAGSMLGLPGGAKPKPGDPILPRKLPVLAPKMISPDLGKMLNQAKQKLSLPNLPGQQQLKFPMTMPSGGIQPPSLPPLPKLPGLPSIPGLG